MWRHIARLLNMTFSKDLFLKEKLPKSVQKMTQNPTMQKSKKPKNMNKTES